MKEWKNTFGSARALRMGSRSVLLTVILLAVLIAVYAVMAVIPVNYTAFDVTARGTFTLSEQTEKLVDSLDQDITLYWLTENGSEDATLENLLNQYSGRSSRIRVIRKDPAQSPTFLEGYGLDSAENNTVIVASGERFRYLESTDIYLYDYSNYYTTGTAEVYFAGESAVTSAIDYCISEELPKLYILTGHGERSLSVSNQSALELENIEFETISLLTGNGIPDDCDGLLMYAPEKDITEEEAEILGSYLENGGNFLLISDPITAGTAVNLEGLMAGYGVSVQPGVIVEGDASHYALGNPVNLVPNMYSHDIVNPLRDGGYQPILSVAHGLIVAAAEDQPLGVTVTTIMNTSDKAYAKVAGYEMTTYNKEAGDVDGPFALGVVIETTVSDGSTGKIVWYPSMYVLDDSMTGKSSGANEDLFLNSLNWMLGQEESSMTIHTKSMSYEYLNLNEQAATTITVLVVGLFPLAYLAVGIVVTMKRKRK